MNARKWVYGVTVLAVLVFALVGISAAAAWQPAARVEEMLTSPDGKGYRLDRDGWIYVHIEGEPHERGYQYGYLVAPELAEILEKTKELTYLETGMEWAFFVEQAQKQFLPHLDDELQQEMQGIADGARAAGTEITWQEVLTWNGYEELTGYWWPNEMAKWYDNYVPPDNEHCSVFIATGSYTRDGEVVMAHNSWDHFSHGQYLNEILDLQPAEGHRIFMQSAPGFIVSFTDFFVTDAGIMGTETTIGGYGQYDATKTPEFIRARHAMQYADTLDQWVELMKEENNGGYANSWLLADSNTGEIMRFELGLKFSKVDRTKDGYFVGFNAPEDPRIRNLECGNTGYADIRMGSGVRRVRLTAAHGAVPGQARPQKRPEGSGRSLRCLSEEGEPRLAHGGRPLRVGRLRVLACPAAVCAAGRGGRQGDDQRPGRRPQLLGALGQLQRHALRRRRLSR